MGTDFVVGQLTPAILFVWVCGFVVLAFVYYWHWRRYLHLNTQRHKATDLHAQLRILADSHLREVQADPEADLLQRKARRYMRYAIIWLIALLPLTVVIYALALMSSRAR